MLTGAGCFASLIPAKDCTFVMGRAPFAECDVEQEKVGHKRNVERNEVPRPSPVKDQRVVCHGGFPYIHVVCHDAIRTAPEEVEQGVDAHDDH